MDVLENWEFSGFLVFWDFLVSLMVAVLLLMFHQMQPHYLKPVVVGIYLMGSMHYQIYQLILLVRRLALHSR
jgi:uncharacterized membrane protein